ncbi:MAG: site-specific integrase [Candidatus Obscuribacter sp.]|jgi:integrase|nr:site-specific integrase [Candidatus Obscuribacter sp.]MBK9770018.1 site-specific integrase [Candidatus Obscuribacter sp.]
MGVHLNKKTGNYYIRVEHYGRDHEKVIGPDKRSAELALAQVKLEIKAAKNSSQGWLGFDKFKRAERPRTFADAAQDYMDERADYKKSSISAYTHILSSHLLPTFGKQTLKDITDSKLRKFQIELGNHLTAAGKPLSQSRINTVMQLMRSILEQEKRAGRIDRNPSESVRRLQEPKTKIDPLTDEELSLALSCVTPHYRAFFTALAYTGARPNEMQALRWSDIDWRSKKISITKGRVRGHEGLPKTASGDRVIPMMPQIENELLLLKQSRVVSLDDYLFTNRNGKPIDKHMDEVWKRALKKAGLRHRPSYQLRHTFVTRCIIENLPIPYIAKIIGHSTIDTLIRHYAGWIDAATNQYEQKLRDSFEVSKPRQLVASSST